MKYQFITGTRDNVFRKNGTEFFLNVRLDGGPIWTLATWEKEPKQEEIKATENIALQAMEAYHTAFVSKSYHFTMRSES